MSNIKYEFPTGSEGILCDQIESIGIPYQSFFDNLSILAKSIEELCKISGYPQYKIGMHYYNDKWIVVIDTKLQRK